MQCYSDLNLKCCDCESTFTSATKLLQHFADHVHQETKTKIKIHSVSSSKSKKRASTQVSMSMSVTQTESSSESNQSRQESTLSVSSEPADSCSETSEPKLARFDLQKRLETCVGSLTAKDDSTDTHIKLEQDDESSIKSPVSDAKVPEEYSPLKFCMITMEENNEKSSMMNNSPKKLASRKQLVPKKIERKIDGLRKLAPKPDNMVSSEVLLQSPGKKKYACHLCTKVFGWSTDLKRHILVHTGERPFKCKTCQATFTRNFLLQKHQSKIHPCKPKECSVKPEIVEVQSITAVSNSDEECLIDPLKEEPTESNEYEEDDEDEDKLIITEEIDEKILHSSLPNCSSDSKWPLVSTGAERRCSDLKQSDLFKLAPVKVLTM